ncbi:hypothetical protein ALI144C_48825 [Actinosynnema sp. ALI-1.44]|uniref:hypothetical protein n=1 Tax=Actinosynnema sp. ALI-1.44 TaxID=1933779 RepID=UPI00097BC0A4|nr:hypothetical protein [Actinosynnema sp. ALI-1.44]ONI70546.1 hypothetical protein ALI144C_48825 [Actinosynnema sp. ALI-1.44]
MERVVVLGRGGAGKSTFAFRLGAVLGLPVIELDKHFWSPDLSPTPKSQWAGIQERLTSAPRWVLDGDLGPHDVLDVRLRASDAVIVLDFPLWRCASRLSSPPSLITPATRNSTYCETPAPSNNS